MENVWGRVRTLLFRCIIEIYLFEIKLTCTLMGMLLHERF